VLDERPKEQTVPAATAVSPLSQKFTDAALDWLVPDWPAPSNVQAFSTTRHGRHNASFDLGETSADLEIARGELRRWLPSQPTWLQQVHGTAVHVAGGEPATPAVDQPCADATVTRVPDVVCAVRSADCLPVLLCDRSGSVVAAAHAGWRGLSAGVIESTISAMGVQPRELLAWLGPAIGAARFEVGDDVLNAFARRDARDVAAFRQAGPERWLADLHGLARVRLQRAGVRHVYGTSICTYDDPQRFYSHRRSRDRGRMASLIWREG
jgi:YfiH family protein